MSETTLREKFKKNILSIAMNQIANDEKQVEMWVNIFIENVNNTRHPVSAYKIEDVLDSICAKAKSKGGIEDKMRYKEQVGRCFQEMVAKNKIIGKLENELAEKDKRIEELKQASLKDLNELWGVLKNKDKRIEELKTEINERKKFSGILVGAAVKLKNEIKRLKEESINTGKRLIV
jgi:predicted RNase H-like nuclease (RuvC/YqgF family)